MLQQLLQGHHRVHVAHGEVAQNLADRHVPAELPLLHQRCAQRRGERLPDRADVEEVVDLRRLVDVRSPGARDRALDDLAFPPHRDGEGRSPRLLAHLRDQLLQRAPLADLELGGILGGLRAKPPRIVGRLGIQLQRVREDTELLVGRDQCRGVVARGRHRLDRERGQFLLDHELPGQLLVERRLGEVAIGVVVEDELPHRPVVRTVHGGDVVA